jgi:uncharacterized protein (DUF1800 family)
MARFLLADEPPPALVRHMAQAFQASGANIGAALRVLVEAPAFSAGPPAKFKDPMHYVLSAVRAAYGERVVANTGPLQVWLNQLGQGLYNRATPDGWPLQAEAWNSSGQMATRFDIARAIGGGNAGLFRGEDAAGAAGAASAAQEQAAFPQLARPIYYQVLRPQMREATRQALDAAASQQDWNALYLASPEFMMR